MQRRYRDLKLKWVYAMSLYGNLYEVNIAVTCCINITSYLY